MEPSITWKAPSAREPPSPSISHYPTRPSSDMENQTQILIVDDQINTCKSLQAILKKSGYHSGYTQSAEEALRRIQDEHYDIVISDIRMPGMDGMALLEELKKIQPSLVVIMITGYATIKSAVEAIQK